VPKSLLSSLTLFTYDVISSLFLALIFVCLCFQFSTFTSENCLDFIFLRVIVGNFPVSTSEFPSMQTLVLHTPPPTFDIAFNVFFFLYINFLFFCLLLVSRSLLTRFSSFCQLAISCRAIPQEECFWKCFSALLVIFRRISSQVPATSNSSSYFSLVALCL
jgi:hypothetical protein